MADRDLTINLKFAKQAAERAAGEFHQGERQRIREDGDAAEAFLKRWSSLWRRLQEGRVKGVQDGYKAEEKAQDDTSKKLVRGAQRQQQALLKLVGELREARIKGIQDAAGEEEKRAKQVDATLRQLREVRLKAAREAAMEEGKAYSQSIAAVYKAQSESAARLLSDARRRQQEYLRLADELREARVKGVQAANQAEDDHTTRMRRARAHALIQMIRDTEARIRAEVKADEDGIKAELDNEKGVEQAKKDVKIQRGREAAEELKRIAKDLDEFEKTMAGDAAAFAESRRKLAQINADAEDKDRTRKFLSNQGFLQERLEAQTRKSNRGQQEETRKTTAEVERHSGQVSTLAKQYLALRFTERTLRTIREGWEAVVRSAADAAKHVEGMVESTRRVRDALTEVHRMEGKTPSSAATAEELKNFSAMAITTDFGIRGKTEWIAQAAGMIQPPNLAPGQNASAYRMSIQQSQELQKFAMQSAAAQGIDPEPAMMLMSTIASKAAVDPGTGKVNTNEVKDTFAKNFGLMATEKGHTAQDVRQFAEAAQKLVRAGGSQEDLNRLAIRHAAQTEIGTNRSRVNIDALYRGVDQLDEKKWEELGIDYDRVQQMNDEERLDAITRAIPRMARDAAGGRFRDDGHQATVERSTARRFFNQQHELDAFMAHLNGGIRGGIYEQRRAEQQAGGRAQTEQKIQEYMQSPQGRQRTEETGLEADRAHRSAMRGSDEFQTFRTQISRAITRGGELEEGADFWQAWKDEKVQQLMLGKRDEYLHHQHTGRQIRERLQKLADQGSEEARDYLATEGGKFQVSPTYLVRDESAQELAYQKLQFLESRRDANIAAGRPAFASDMAVQNAAKSRALSDMQSRGSIPPGVTLQQLQAAPRPPSGGDMAAPGVIPHRPRDPLDVHREAVDAQASQIVEEQRRRHGANNEAILRNLAPPSNAAANEAHLKQQAAQGEGPQAFNATERGITAMGITGGGTYGMGGEMPRHPGDSTAFNLGPHGANLLAAQMVAQVRPSAASRQRPLGTHRDFLEQLRHPHKPHHHIGATARRPVPSHPRRTPAPRHKQNVDLFPDRDVQAEESFYVRRNWGNGRGTPGRDRQIGIVAPGHDHRLGRDYRRGGSRDRMRGSMPIEILTDADKKRRAEWAANTAALSEPRRRAEAAKKAQAAESAAYLSGGRNFDQAIASAHIARNHEDLARHHAAAHPTPPPPAPVPQIPDYGFGHGPLARGVQGMLRPGPPLPPNPGPAPGPNRASPIRYPDAGWWKGDYDTYNHGGGRKNNQANSGMGDLKSVV